MKLIASFSIIRCDQVAEAGLFTELKYPDVARGLTVVEYTRLHLITKVYQC